MAEPFPFYIHAETPVHLRGWFRKRSCFLIAGGPSFAELDHAPLAEPGILTFGMNNSVKTFRPRLWSHADVPQNFLRSIFEDPNIIKFSPMQLNRHRIYDNAAKQFTRRRLRDMPGVMFFDRQSDQFKPEEFLTRPQAYWGSDGKKGGGRSVMLSSIRCMYEIGIRRVFLLGVDFNMSESSGYHFDQHCHKGTINGNNGTYQKLRERFAALRPIFEDHGFHIYNCNPASKLEAFDYVPYDEAIRLVHEQEFGGIDWRNEPSEGMYNVDKGKPEETHNYKPESWVKVESAIRYPVELSITPTQSEPVEVPPMIEQSEREYDVSIITPTGDRPVMIELCKRWMKRQTFAGSVQWIVVDDGGEPTDMSDFARDEWDVVYTRRQRGANEPPHTLPLNLARGLELVKSDRLAIIEDDDWYRADYLETVYDRLNEYDLVGEGSALYVRLDADTVKVKPFGNMGHASLAATAFARRGISDLRKTLQSFKRPTVDMHFWQNFKGSSKVFPRDGDNPLIVQLKAMPGRKGPLGAHKPSMPGFREYDTGGVMFGDRLKRWVGEDIAAYIPMMSDGVKDQLGIGEPEAFRDQVQSTEDLSTNKPILSIVTRHMPGKRDRGLQRLQTSIKAANRASDIQHVVIRDEVCDGDVARANGLFHEHRGQVRGEWVIMIDDDDILMDMDIVGIVENAPAIAPVIGVKGTIGSRVFPECGWGDARRLKQCKIGIFNVIVRREWWHEHINAFAGGLRGDWRFIDRLRQVTNPDDWHWVDRIVAHAPQPNRGRGEDNPAGEVRIEVIGPEDTPTPGAIALSVGHNPAAHGIFKASKGFRRFGEVDVVAIRVDGVDAEALAMEVLRTGGRYEVMGQVVSTRGTARGQAAGA